MGATKIATMTREDYLSWDVEGPHQARLEAMYAQVMQSRLPDQMIRYDCCAGIDLKRTMAQGVFQWEPAFGEVNLDDPRLMDIIFELPYEEIALWQRPWIKPYVLSGYPVEYRVYVRDGRMVGISNYYPQRDLPLFETHLAVISHYTRALIEALEPPFIWNNGLATQINQNGDNPLDLDGIHFTADYIVSENNAILFLEGGPPHEFGAGACCFLENQIDGIALIDRH